MTDWSAVLFLVWYNSEIPAPSDLYPDYLESNTMAVDSFVLHAGYLISDGSIYLKVLVPSVAAGAIIGKGGETIAQVQKEVNARIKMSKANDFYPGSIPF